VISSLFRRFVYRLALDFTPEKNRPRLPIREVGFEDSCPRPAPYGGLEGYAGGL